MPSLVEVYNFIPDVLTQLSGLGHCGEVGVCLSVWTCHDRRKKRTKAQRGVTA